MLSSFFKSKGKNPPPNNPFDNLEFYEWKPKALEAPENKQANQFFEASTSRRLYPKVEQLFENLPVQNTNSTSVHIHLHFHAPVNGDINILELLPTTNTPRLRLSNFESGIRKALVPFYIDYTCDRCAAKMSTDEKPIYCSNCGQRGTLKPDWLYSKI